MSQTCNALVKSGVLNIALEPSPLFAVKKVSTQATQRDFLDDKRPNVFERSLEPAAVHVGRT